MSVSTSPPIFYMLTVCLVFSALCQGNIQIDEYKLMPALYKFDNYDDCVNRVDVEPKFQAKYCMVFVQLQPANNSSVWQQIELMSAKKYNYRHDLLYRGVCMDRCKDLLSNNKQYKNLDNGLLTSEQTEMFQKYHNNSLDWTMRTSYQNEIYECVNREYLENYNLSTRTFVNFCIDPEQRKEKDKYFHLTILLIIVFVALNIVSTMYDAKLKTQQFQSDEKHNYYEIQHKDKVKRYLTAFSLYRNYKRLLVPNNSDIGLDLGFLDGFRAILCLLIIFEHSFLLQFFHIENPEFIEDIWSKIQTKLFLHALIWLELFFVLSGLLMYVKFEKSQYVTHKTSFLDCLHVFVRLLISRYLRYLPSLLFVIIFAANITYYNENGTFTRNIIDANCIECRENWWQNLLMVNNYDMKSSCLMHTWYIAADFQLYGLFLIILIIMAKYPKFKTLILIGVAILAAAINFGVNYLLKLDSIFMLLPESYRYFYFQNIETAKHLYFSSYTNINSFQIGVVCGFIYMKYLRKNPENKELLGKILKNVPYIGWPCIFGILFLGTTIVMHTETTVWTAAYGLLQRHVGLAIVAVIVILRGMCNGGGVFKSSFFRFLARISFQVYLWQIVVFMNILVLFNEPISVSHSVMSCFGLVLYFTSSIIAFVVALLVEYPIAEIIIIIDIERKIKPIKTS